MPKPPFPSAHWPFEQPGVLLSIKAIEHAIELERLKTSTSIRDVSLQDFDDDDVDYSPSDDDSDRQEEPDEEELEGETGYWQDGTEPMDLDIDENELQDLARDIEENRWPSSPTISEKERAKEENMQKELSLLHAAEKDGAAAYNSDEVVGLLTEFYELLVEIAHWPLGSVQKAPHMDPPVNIQLGKELGYDEAVLQLMQRLPYPKDMSRSLNKIVPDSFFYDYTKERDLKKARKHVGYDNDKYGTPIDSWILPLVGPSNRDGWSIVLDTRLGMSPFFLSRRKGKGGTGLTVTGVIRAYNPMNGPPKQAIEFKRHGKEEEGPLEYHRAPFVPAAKYVRGLIDCYRAMDRVPMMDAYHSDPNFAKVKLRESLNWYYENVSDAISLIIVGDKLEMTY